MGGGGVRSGTWSDTYSSKCSSRVHDTSLVSLWVMLFYVLLYVRTTRTVLPALAVAGSGTLGSPEAATPFGCSTTILLYYPTRSLRASFMTLSLVGVVPQSVGDTA